MKYTDKVGTNLKRLISKYVGAKPWHNCQCEEKAKIMDERGIEWCESHKDRIVWWLERAARATELKMFSEFVARRLLNHAIRLAKWHNVEPSEEPQEIPPCSEIQPEVLETQDDILPQHQDYEYPTSSQ